MGREGEEEGEGGFEPSSAKTEKEQEWPSKGSKEMEAMEGEPEEVETVWWAEKESLEDGVVPGLGVASRNTYLVFGGGVEIPDPEGRAMG